MLAPIYETIARVKQELPPSVALLGFCGAPWTVATYMIAGGGTVDQLPAREFAYRHREAFAELIEVLVEASASYLIRQFEAGVDAVQIFDTWAGVLPPDEFRKWCIEPCARIVAAVRKRIPEAKIIGFPRGAGTKLTQYLAAVPVDAVGLDWMIELGFARDRIQQQRPVQGNLDPLALLAGGAALDRAIDVVSGSLRATGRLFSISAMACCRKRRLRMWSGWSRACAASPVETRRSATRSARRRMYQWIKAFHIIAVIAWMAGMLYLPRLFVYHCAAEKGSVQSETFKVMERRLLRAIINPAMIATWLLGTLARLARA